MNGVWEEVKQQIRSEIPEQSFSLWIKPIVFVERNKDTIVLGCPNKFSRNWVVDNYGPLLENKLSQSGGGDLQVSFQVKSAPIKPVVPKNIRESRQLSFPNMQRRGILTAHRLKNNLTFDRFVVGKCNEFAYSVSRSVSSGSDMPYAPVFMLANTGLGKSHLAQAIGHAVLSADPKSRVCYVTAEDFVNEMIFSLKTGKIEDFKTKYRRDCDVLLLEEVHFLGGKEKTQKELEYTLDALINERKKIIFTSAVLPKDISGLSKEMESRLTSGIITAIQRPDYSTRLKLLEKKAEEMNLKLSEEAEHLLAKHLNRDVRQIESALSSLKAKKELLKEKISKSLVMEVIRCHVSQVSGRSLEDIMGLVCRYFNLDKEVLPSRSRKKSHAYPRNLYSYLCRTYTGATLEEIGASINRNHSTVLYGSEVIASKSKTDRNVKKQLDFFTNRIEVGTP